MNVLFLCQRVPYPPDRGDRITTWHVLEHLLDRGASVRLGCFSEEHRDATAVDWLRGRCQEVCAPRLDRRRARLSSLRGLLTGEALTLPFFRHRRLAGAVDRWFAQQRPDLVYVYSSSMAQYALPHPGPVRLMQFAELDSDKWAQFAAQRRGPSRWLYAREARRLLAFETTVAQSFDGSFVVSETERQLFQQRIPSVVPTVLPNGVDVEHFRSSGEQRREPHTLVFTGVMDYAPNVDGICWFAAACWPAIRARFAAARLWIVGSNPTAAVRALAQQPGIEVTGRVDTTPPWFDRSTVAIAPLRLARGVQNKVLEALSMGL
ncbi:MAG TPA: TIGR03087 family PEP-CTERM/XrtA system glycosyltransferase, partial [Planctomycetota bacterium]|nr:TIGR03087 family PEP-CTERM/XrtA system glycosyltransferase [Planctomycetota bacterium]